jgi:Raf kinase inhibitor-like YbhB/YbcL family protein
MRRYMILLVAVALGASVLCSCGSGAPPEPTPAPATPTRILPTATQRPPTATSPPPEPTAPPPTAKSPSQAPTEPPPTPTLSPPTAPVPPPTPEPASGLTMDSATFRHGGRIMAKHSCFGDNLSPPINWQGVPQDAESLVLKVIDPDSQPPGFVHWVIYNLPPHTTYLPEGVPADAELWDGSLQGVNDFAQYPAGSFPGGAAINQIGYDGPCPPAEHRYLFTLYALDTLLDLEAGATLDRVLEATEGHVLAQGKLEGLFAPP